MLLCLVGNHPRGACGFRHAKRRYESANPVLRKEKGAKRGARTVFFRARAVAERGHCAKTRAGQTCTRGPPSMAITGSWFLSAYAPIWNPPRSRGPYDGPDVSCQVAAFPRVSPAPIRASHSDCPLRSPIYAMLGKTHLCKTTRRLPPLPMTTASGLLRPRFKLIVRGGIWGWCQCGSGMSC